MAVVVSSVVDQTPLPATLPTRRPDATSVDGGSVKWTRVGLDVGIDLRHLKDTSTTILARHVGLGV